MADLPSSSTPMCAVHRERPAAGVCQRCGSFMCPECGEFGSATLCPGCRERGAAGAGTFPLSRDRWSLGEIFSVSWDAFSREWLMLCVSTLVFFAIAFAVSMVGNLLQAGAMALDVTAVTVVVYLAVFLVSMAVQGALQLGLYRMTFDVLRGGKAEIAVLFSQFSKSVRVVLQSLAVILAMMLPIALWAGATMGVVFAVGKEHVVPVVALSVLLGIVPVTAWTLSFMFAQLELANDDEVGPVQAILRSFALVRGFRLPIFGVTIVVGFVVLAGILACCVGMLASVPFGSVLMSALYLSLRKGSEVDPAPAATPSAQLPPA